MTRWNGGNSDYDAFPSRELQVELVKIVTLSTLKYVSLSVALNCPSLQPFCSLVLLTHANTLDRSRHFESGTFLNRHHYRDIWYIHIQHCTDHMIWSYTIIYCTTGQPRQNVQWQFSWIAGYVALIFQCICLLCISIRIYKLSQGYVCGSHTRTLIQPLRH